MKQSHLPVIAVIPAHNNAKTLRPLLDELIKQKYDDIYVIDDASTDETTEVAKSYGPKVKLIESDENVGSGANRNRIIGRGKGSILHFIDADMRLLSKNTPDIIRSLEWDSDTAYFGGLIRNPHGEQNPWNYGPRNSFVVFLQSGLQYGIWRLGLRFKPMAAILRFLLHPLLLSFPNIYIGPRSRRTFWTAESNMIILAETYAELGGFDPRFRYGEISDFAHRIYRLGLKTYFDPRVDLIHASLDNVLQRRNEKYTAHKEFLKKHGYLTYYIPPLADFLAGLKTQKRYHK